MCTPHLQESLRGVGNNNGRDLPCIPDQDDAQERGLDL